MLIAAILALSVACSFEAVCEESQEQVAPGGRHSKVRCPLTESKTAGRLGSVCLSGGRDGSGLAGLGIMSLNFFLSLVLSCFCCLQGIPLCLGYLVDKVCPKKMLLSLMWTEGFAFMYLGVYMSQQLKKRQGFERARGEDTGKVGRRKGNGRSNVIIF